MFDRKVCNLRRVKAGDGLLGNSNRNESAVFLLHDSEDDLATIF